MAIVKRAGFNGCDAIGDVRLSQCFAVVEYAMRKGCNAIGEAYGRELDAVGECEPSDGNDGGWKCDFFYRAAPVKGAPADSRNACWDVYGGKMFAIRECECPNRERSAGDGVRPVG